MEVDILFPEATVFFRKKEWSRWFGRNETPFFRLKKRRKRKKIGTDSRNGSKKQNGFVKYGGSDCIFRDFNF